MRRLGEHEPSTLRRQEHPLRDQVWSGFEGKDQTLYLKSTEYELNLEGIIMNLNLSSYALLKNISLALSECNFFWSSND